MNEQNWKLTILLPLMGNDIVPFKPESCKMSMPIDLLGLEYLGIKMQIQKTDSNNKHINMNATKIMRFLLNPFLIYSSAEIFGDAILTVSGCDNRVMDKKARIAMINILIEQTYKDKGSKKMPEQLRSWIEGKRAMLLRQIEHARKEGKDVNAMDRTMDHMLKNIASYGMDHI